MPYTITSTVFFVCYHGRFKRGGEDEKVQSQIQNFMVWIFMGSNLFWRGFGGPPPRKFKKYEVL